MRLYPQRPITLGGQGLQTHAVQCHRCHRGNLGKGVSPGKREGPWVREGFLVSSGYLRPFGAELRDSADDSVARAGWPVGPRKG